MVPTLLKIESTQRFGKDEMEESEKIEEKERERATQRVEIAIEKRTPEMYTAMKEAKMTSMLFDEGVRVRRGAV